MKAVKVYNNFIFDLDGTLFHTSPSVLSKFASAFDEAGVEVKKELLKEEIMGPPVDMIISGLVPSISETERGLVKEIFRAAYDSDPVTGTSFFPGVEKTLKTLKDSGKKLFMKLLVSTNINSKSKIIIYRNVIDRVHKIMFQLPGLPGKKSKYQVQKRWRKAGIPAYFKWIRTCNRQNDCSCAGKLPAGRWQCYHT